MIHLKTFANRAEAFAEQKAKGFPHVYKHDDVYCHPSLSPDDAYYTGMVLTPIDLAKWEALGTQWSHYKIYRYVEATLSYRFDEAPVTHNFNTGLSVRLYPVITWTKGRITKCEYFASASLDANGEEVGDDLIVQEEFSYTNDSAGLARHRLQTITWFLESGDAGDVKYREKIYNNAGSRTEGRRRRRNVIDNMSIGVVGLLAATETAGDINAAIAMGTAYMATHESRVQEYIEMALDNLESAVADDIITSWLDNDIGGGVTIRDYIVGELQ